MDTSTPVSPHGLADGRVTGRQLRAARILLGWSRSDVALRADLSKAKIAQLEEEEIDVSPLKSARALRAALEAGGARFCAGADYGVLISNGF